MSGLANPAQWLIDWFRGPTNDSPVAINRVSALEYSSVWQAVSIISGDIASLPFPVYRRTSDEEREETRNHPAWWLLNEESNELMTANILRETVQAQVLMMGNGYIAIEWDQLMRPMRLVPLMADQTKLNDDNLYEWYEEPGSAPQFIAPRDIIHIKGLGWDGRTGYYLLGLARNSLGLGLSQQRHGNRHFSNDAKPGVILKHPRKLDKQFADELLANFEERHGSDPGKPALLHGGLELEIVPANNSDSQWLESRKFQRQEVASWFNLPPHKLGDSERTSYNSIEQEQRAYLNETLRRWLTKWEWECRTKLVMESDRRNYSVFMRHDTRELLRGDLQTRATAYETMIRSRVMNPNEARRLENMPSYEGGDEFLNPNITQAGAPSSEPSDEPPVNRTRWRNMLVDKIGPMLKVEQDRCTRAAKKGENMTVWMDKFYPDWNSKLQETLASTVACAQDYFPTIPDVEHIASDLEAQGRSRVLSVTQNSFQDNLLDNVQDMFTDQNSRAVEVANTLVGITGE